jgi:hypothetical protein
MSRIPRVTGSALLTALAKAGFAVIRVKLIFYSWRRKLAATC